MLDSVASHFAVAGMEPQIVACIRMALGPWEWGGILWQVWNLRNEILKNLIQCSTWPSDAIKYEAICLVIKYWSDEPVPERPDTRSSEGSSEQREATLSVQRGARPVETDNKRRILVELHDILPEIPHFDPPVMVGHFLDLPCEEGTTSEDAYPKCHMCFDQHCG